MSISRLDKQGDWLLFSFADEKEAVAFDLVTRLREFKNDCYFSMSSGINWLDRGGSASPDNKKLLDVEIKTIILNTENIVELINYNSYIDTIERKIRVEFSIKTIYGTTQDVIYINL